MEKSFFTLWFRLNRNDGYLIWILDEPESILLEEDGLIPVFRTEVALALYAKAKQTEIVNEEPILHDLDIIKEWLLEPGLPINCHVFLPAWNLFTDVANGLNKPFTGDQRDQLTRGLYDKLFFGNNIAGILVRDEYCIPQWTLGEEKSLQEILTEGMLLFESNIKEMLPC
jgi:hypothetical protein